MNTKKNMIIIKGEIKTAEVISCQYNQLTHKMDVTFDNGRTYPYAYLNVEWLREPQVLNPKMYQISKGGHAFFGIEEIYVFHGNADTYWHICFSGGKERDYAQRELKIRESCLNQGYSENVFEYIRQIANLSELKNEDTGEKLLTKQFEKISFIGDDVALAKYLNPPSLQSHTHGRDYIPIFPFGCNNSQYQAVKSAMENQISVIQGPPGTGKTQTILNIIANILVQGKTVQIVSNNNSATENVYEKLSSSKYNLGFIAATLGSVKNKKAFIEQQDASYPDFLSWRSDEDRRVLRQNILEKSMQLKLLFDKQEELACLKQEQSQLETEFSYFKEYAENWNVGTNFIARKKKVSAKCWMAMMRECQMILENKQKFGLLFKIRGLFRYGISDPSFYKQDAAKIITGLQMMYYCVRQSELEKAIKEIEEYLQGADSGLLDNLCSQSMKLLKDRLAEKYGNQKGRILFQENDLWENSDKVLEEYPVILSTTFSARSSLHADVVYDYLIMDEASQVDIATGALALSCAKNAVIVGDTKQLPNVVKGDVEGKADAVFNDFHVHEGYRYTKSFLQSVLEVLPNVTQTLLREHYRCHPKIIGFCNQKFYKGELIIMTKDNGEEDVLTAVKTVPGNHARGHYSQRQIDVIKNEIIPKYVENLEETGIISPYRDQVKNLERECGNIDVATVHKFQGKEKDTIIISTVDDELTDFADDPYLINVAVSRAKKKLILVTTGNEQTRERNITDLIDYIQYHNFEVTDSKVYSVFDYLYKQYAEERKDYLRKHKRISQYDSENLMYLLIDGILAEDKYAGLDMICHFPMRMLIKNLALLDERERQYARNPATHIDFLIFNRISKKPVLAVEVDGYEYHKADTVQSTRDTLKDHILKLYKIPLLRFWTNGSGEKEKLTEMLDVLVR